MVRYTKKRGYRSKRTKKQRGGVGKLGKLGNMSALGSLFASRRPPAVNASVVSSTSKVLNSSSKVAPPTIPLEEIPEDIPEDVCVSVSKAYRIAHDSFPQQRKYWFTFMDYFRKLREEAKTSKCRTATGTAPVTGTARVPAPVENASSVNESMEVYKNMLRKKVPKQQIIQKMITDGKNPKNLFPTYDPTEGLPAKTVFTVDDFKILKSYGIDDSEIVFRMKSFNLDPKEIYPTMTNGEINTIFQELSKKYTVAHPQVVPVPEAINFASALKQEIKKRGIVAEKPENSKGDAMSFFINYTNQEKSHLTLIDNAEKRIKKIDAELSDIKKTVEVYKKQGRKLADVRLKAIPDLLKEKSNLTATITKLFTDKLKKKMAFVKGEIKVMVFSVDSIGPLPNGWVVIVNRSENKITYASKYNISTVYNERPTENSTRPELPEGWEINETPEEVWYINKLTGKRQSNPPKEVAVSFNTSGWTKINDQFSWYKEIDPSRTYDTGGVWFKVRDSDNMWFENQFEYPDQKFNEPPELGQPQNVTNSWKAL